MSRRRDLPETVGLCPVHVGEFYMPDADRGDRCPEPDCTHPLTIYSVRVVPFQPSDDRSFSTPPAAKGRKKAIRFRNISFIGPEERKLRNRLIFAVTGRWPRAVVEERTGGKKKEEKS